MKVCFFGIYNPEYSRNRVLINGLKQNGVELIECRTELKGIKKYFDLIKKHCKIKNDYDVLFVAFPGYQVMILARFLTRKKIIFDAFASIYDSEVNDRKTTKENSLKAKYYWILDWLSCKLSNNVLLDTGENIKYFVKEFGISKEKFIRVFVGADNNFENKQEENVNEKFKIIFYGSNIPLQGVRYMLDSTKIIKDENVEFDIIGSSIKKQFGGEKIEGVRFFENLNYNELVKRISDSDICLGIFGDTEKTQRVIPNKIYDYASLKKPIITSDTLVIRELFDERDLLLVPTAKPQKIAEAILFLKNNPEIRRELSENAYNKFKQNCTSEIIVKKLLREINS